ncbi:MAG: DUF177 domain-containing protein [Acidobacteriota bacterium]|nr:DUF177 domain-containing protein [Acidobacteriota bacterium]
MSAPHDPSALSVNLAAVPSQGARVAVSTAREAFGFPEAEFQIVGGLRLHGRLDRLERDGFRLRAHLGGELRLECVRCLAPVPLPVNEELDLVYLPRVAESASLGGGERALEASDMNVSFYDEDRLELAETVWEQLHLALPSKPLCFSGCLGLCSSCGADRNHHPGCCCDENTGRPDRSGLGALRELAGFTEAPG